jgi:hypothetical protein
MSEFNSSPHVKEIESIISDALAQVSDTSIRARASKLGQSLSRDHRVALFDQVDAILKSRKVNE